MIPTYTKLFLAHFSARLQGVDPADPQSFAMAKGLAESPQTQLAGLYTHGGHSYDAQVGPLGDGGWDLGETGRPGDLEDCLGLGYGDLFQEDWHIGWTTANMVLNMLFQKRWLIGA